MSLSTTVSTDWSWLKTHLVLLAIVIVLAFGEVYGVEALMASRTASTDAKRTAILTTQTAQTQLFLKQLQTDEAQIAQVEQQLLAMNANLTSTMLQRGKQTQVQVKKDATLDAKGAASRLTTQLGTQPGEVTAAGDTVVASLPTGRLLVAVLDKCQETDADLIDTQKQLANETTLFENSQKNVAEQAAFIVTLTAQNTAQKNADAATIANLKAQGRKGKLKWFGIGFVTGWVAGTISGHWL